MPLKDDNDIDYWGNDSPVCPYCDSVFNIDENEAYHLYDEDGDRDLTCPDCEKKYNVKVHVKHTFSTDDQDED